MLLFLLRVLVSVLGAVETLAVKKRILWQTVSALPLEANGDNYKISGLILRNIGVSLAFFLRKFILKQCLDSNELSSLPASQWLADTCVHNPCMGGKKEFTESFTRVLYKFRWTSCSDWRCVFPIHQVLALELLVSFLCPVREIQQGIKKYQVANVFTSVLEKHRGKPGVFVWSAVLVCSDPLRCHPTKLKKCWKRRKIWCVKHIFLNQVNNLA